MDVAAVRFKLSLAGALGAYGALAAGSGLTLQMGPHANKTGQQVLVLGQLHLQASFLGLGSLGKNIQNQATAVNNLHTQKLREHSNL